MKRLFYFPGLCILLATAVSAAPPLKSRIDGKITDKRGYVMHGLTVRAINRESRKQITAITDDQGRFVFDNLEPGRYLLVAECIGVEKILGAVQLQPGATEPVELLAEPVRPSGIAAVDKHIASMEAQGGRYPAGNISYLNVNDAMDLYFMWIYFGILGLLSIYGVYRYRLVYLFLRYKNHPPVPKARYEPNRLPRVTVQLPLFNEMYVAERLIESVPRLD